MAKVMLFWDLDVVLAENRLTRVVGDLGGAFVLLDLVEGIDLGIAESPGIVRRVRRLERRAGAGAGEPAGTRWGGRCDGRSGPREGAEVSGVVVSIMDVWRWVVATITGGQDEPAATGGKQPRPTTGRVAPDPLVGEAGEDPSGWERVRGLHKEDCWAARSFRCLFPSPCSSRKPTVLPDSGRSQERVAGGCAPGFRGLLTGANGSGGPDPRRSVRSFPGKHDDFAFPGSGARHRRHGREPPGGFDDPAWGGVCAERGAGGGGSRGWKSRVGRRRIWCCSIW